MAMSNSAALQVQHSLPPAERRAGESPMWKLIMVAAIGAGVEFGWAMQLSLLTPYVQLLGISHAWSSFIWLGGPMSGMFVQPIVGYYSDNCSSRFGRRRPFIAAGAALVAVAAVLISFAADIDRALGDGLGKGAKPRAIAVFVVGFRILDVANNILKGPCRAFLADLSGGEPRKKSTANALFSFFMAVGKVLGCAAGSLEHLHKVFPFAKTTACDVYCANLKSCFFISIALLTALTVIALTLVPEPEHFSNSPEIANNEIASVNRGVPKIPLLGELLAALKELPRHKMILLLVRALNCFAWFPFLLFDTDWMGKEVYGGKVGEGKLYDLGVRAGAIGLMINAVVLGFTSLAIGQLSSILAVAKRLWGVVNFLLAICLALTVLITKLAEAYRRRQQGVGEVLPPHGIRVGALALFGVLGIPQAVTHSIQFAWESNSSSSAGSGQGLSLGVLLNLSIVIPQVIISLVGRLWDGLFGGGNLPAFVAGAVAATASGIFALTMLPTPTDG